MGGALQNPYFSVKKGRFRTEEREIKRLVQFWKRSIIQKNITAPLATVDWARSDLTGTFDLSGFLQRSQRHNFGEKSNNRLKGTFSRKSRRNRVKGNKKRKSPFFGLY